MKNDISFQEKKFRRMELSEVDPDIIIAADKAKMGYDPERLLRLQVARDLRKVRKFLEKLAEKGELI